MLTSVFSTGLLTHTHTVVCVALLQALAAASLLSLRTTTTQRANRRLSTRFNQLSPSELSLTFLFALVLWTAAGRDDIISA